MSSSLLGLGVGTAFTFANAALGPTRHNKAKTEPYESGLPSEVKKSFRFGISFYLIAMLFILFDIEVVFLYPVALQLEAFGAFALVETDRVRGAAAGGARVRLEKGSARVEITRTKLGDGDDFRSRQLNAQQMLRGDLEGDDLEEYVEKRLLLTKFEDAQNWARQATRSGRSASGWPAARSR